MNTYLPVTSVSQDFFGIIKIVNLGAVNNIPIQYKLDGLSVLVPVDTYSTTVTYTVSN